MFNENFRDVSGKLSSQSEFIPTTVFMWHL